MVSVNLGGGIETLDKNGVIGSSGGSHDTSLIDILDIPSLYGISVEDDGEVGNVASVFFESLWTLNCVSLLIGMDAVFQLLDHGSGACLDSLDTDQVVSLLLSEGRSHALFPVGLGFQ